MALHGVHLHVTILAHKITNCSEFSTLLFQFVFLLESSRSNIAMSLGTCAVVDIGNHSQSYHIGAAATWHIWANFFNLVNTSMSQY